MIRSVTLLGSASGRNAGDAALMSGIMDSIDDACGRRLLYEIPTLKPDFVRRNYANDVRAIDVMPWTGSARLLGLPTFRSIMRTDLTLVFDAVLFDRKLYNPLFNFLSSLYLLLPRAKKHDKLMGLFNVSVGPLTTEIGRRMLKKVAETVDFISVREADDLASLEGLGVRHDYVFLGADAALNVPIPDGEQTDRVLRRCGIDPDVPFIAVNVSRYIDTWTTSRKRPIGRSAFIDTMASSLNRVTGLTGAPLLLVATQYQDMELTRELRARLDCGRGVGLLSNTDHTHHEVKAALGRAALLVSMRLHPVILATSELTPAVGLCCLPKIRHYFRTLGLEEHCIDFADFSESTLVRRIMDAWLQRDAIRHRLQQLMPQLKDKARLAALLVAALDQGADLATAFALATAEPASTSTAA